MKYLMIALTLVLSGCASAPSDYNQGCRDGIGSIMLSPNQKGIADYCDAVEKLKEGQNTSLDRPRGRTSK